jgi:hypothetical protein
MLASSSPSLQIKSLLKSIPPSQAHQPVLPSIPPQRLNTPRAYSLSYVAHGIVIDRIALENGHLQNIVNGGSKGHHIIFKKDSTY